MGLDEELEKHRLKFDSIPEFLRKVGIDAVRAVRDPNVSEEEAVTRLFEFSTASAVVVNNTQRNFECYSKKL